MRAARPAIHARRAALVLFAMALAIGVLPGPVAAAPRHAYRENIAGPRDWVAQATFVQCVGASLQMMLNIVHPGTTHRRRPSTGSRTSRGRGAGRRRRASSARARASAAGSRAS